MKLTFSSLLLVAERGFGDLLGCMFFTYGFYLGCACSDADVVCTYDGGCFPFP
jgi:hypothetical protein